MKVLESIGYGLKEEDRDRIYKVDDVRGCMEYSRKTFPPRERARIATVALQAQIEVNQTREVKPETRDELFSILGGVGIKPVLLEEVSNERL